MAADEPAVRLLTWHYREQPPLGELRQAVADLFGGYLVEVTTNTSDYAVVLSDRPLDDAQVNEAWRRWWEGGDGG